MTRSRITLFALALLCITWLPASARQANTLDSIDSYLQERMEALNIPGAAVAVVRDGEIVHLAGYGVANDVGDPVTPQTPFLLASLSKSMTAVAVMQLVEAGQVELDAPIRQYLPWFMPDAPITVRQLLNQTSGLDELQGYERNLDRDGPDALEQSIRRLAEGDLNRPPGTAFEYSNSNADVLGLLIEKVTGESYGDYMLANLFEPLGMTNAYTSLEAARAAGMSEAFYPFFGRQMNLDAITPYSRATLPSAGIIGSVEDMAHYLQLHLDSGRFGNTQLLSPTGMATLHAPAVETGPNADYAMGWFVWRFNEAAPPNGDPPTALSHGGGGLGLNNLMLLIPERELGVVALMTGRDFPDDAAFDNVAFNVALLALGQAAAIPAPQPEGLDRWLRLLSTVLILILLMSAVWAIRRLRGETFSRRDGWIFLGLAAVDLALLGYLLLIRLPDNKTTVSLTLHYQPDLGLLLIVILLLTAGWGNARTLWAFLRWQKGEEQITTRTRP